MANISSAQNVNIPDVNFKNSIISAGVDTNTDGEISYGEAEAISSMYVSGNNISDLTGIEAFINLDTLDCSWNQLTSLDVSSNIDLIELHCEGNQLTSLNVSSCTVLEYLNCHENQLTGLNLSNNAALKYLDCSENQLNSLNVYGCTALKSLYCFANKLTGLDVSNNTSLIILNSNYNQLTDLDVSYHTALTELSCADNLLTSLNVSNSTSLIYLNGNSNQLASLDISDNTALMVLYCTDNKLTSLDISNNTPLVELYCADNKLTSLDVSGNTSLSWLNLSFMPTLYEVCVWEVPFPLEDVAGRVDTTGSPNLYFTADCAVKIPDDYQENSKINIYPNPADDVINIEIENTDNLLIEVYNVNGKMLFSKLSDSKIEKTDVSHFPKGIYFIKVIRDNSAHIEKVVVR